MFGCPSVVLQQPCDRASAEVLPQDSGAFYVAGKGGIVEGPGAWTPRAEGGAGLMWQGRIQVLLAAVRRLRLGIAQFRLHSCHIRPATNVSLRADCETGGDVVGLQYLRIGMAIT